MDLARTAKATMVVAVEEATLLLQQGSLRVNVSALVDGRHVAAEGRNGWCHLWAKVASARCLEALGDALEVVLESVSEKLAL